jgi:hypothetical protein
VSVASVAEFSFRKENYFYAQTNAGKIEQNGLTKSGYMVSVIPNTTKCLQRKKRSV